MAAGESRTVDAELAWTDQVVARDTRLDLIVSWTAGQEARDRSTSQPLRVTCAETPTTPTAVTFVDSEETVGEDAAAANAIDGDPATIWHTQRQGGSPPHPHEIRLDLGQVMDVCALHYLPRQSGGRRELGRTGRDRDVCRHPRRKMGTIRRHTRPVRTVRSVERGQWRSMDVGGGARHRRPTMIPLPSEWIDVTVRYQGCT